MVMLTVCKDTHQPTPSHVRTVDGHPKRSRDPPNALGAGSSWLSLSNLSSLVSASRRSDPIENHEIKRALRGCGTYRTPPFLLIPVRSHRFILGRICMHGPSDARVLRWR